MGICLDTDQQDGSQVFEEAGAQSTEKWRREVGILSTPASGKFPMQNFGTVNFESPTVPVIFVLGGPGSGKVTHCDHLTQEKRGIVHINMTDLLQQYALGNDMQDFGLLSSKTVAEVLMLEMKMSPGAKTFLVSGYPRNMRDVVEYSEKIQIMNGAILVAWKQEILERQIDYGAQLGQVIIELARMELDNFYKHVMPVADYFDHSDMLLVVNGERNPSEVYVDFRESVMRILGLADDGTMPTERQSSSAVEAEVEVERDQEGVRKEASPVPVAIQIEPVQPAPSESAASSQTRSAPRVNGEDETLASKRTVDVPRKRLPSIVWVLGGPGSNKSAVCAQAVKKMPNWVHLSMANVLSQQAASSPMIREALSSGDMVPTEMVELLVEKEILLNRNCSGIVIDGYPRDLTQARDFENKFGQRPEMLLLDVAQQNTSRGKVYDSAEAFKRRLNIFRELSMPLLKSLDAQDRLTLVEENTPADRQQFASALLELMRRAARHEDDPNRITVLTDGDVDKARSTQPNGIAKPVANGVGQRNPAVLGNGAAGGRSKPMSMANGSVPSKQTSSRKATNKRTSQQNDQTKKPITTQTRRQQFMNGGAHLIQNGIPPRMANGYLPKTNNRVAPVNYNRQNGTIASVDPLRQMYTEIDDFYNFPPTNLHI